VTSINQWKMMHEANDRAAAESNVFSGAALCEGKATTPLKTSSNINIFIIAHLSSSSSNSPLDVHSTLPTATEADHTQFALSTLTKRVKKSRLPTLPVFDSSLPSRNRNHEPRFSLHPQISRDCNPQIFQQARSTTSRSSCTTLPQSHREFQSHNMTVAKESCSDMMMSSSTCRQLKAAIHQQHCYRRWNYQQPPLLRGYTYNMYPGEELRRLYICWTYSYLHLRSAHTVVSNKTQLINELIIQKI
jgi:hypothetical protein